MQAQQDTMAYLIKTIMLFARMCSGMGTTIAKKRTNTQMTDYLITTTLRMTTLPPLTPGYNKVSARMHNGTTIDEDIYDPVRPLHYPSVDDSGPEHTTNDEGLLDNYYSRMTRQQRSEEEMIPITEGIGELDIGTSLRRKAGKRKNTY